MIVLDLPGIAPEASEVEALGRMVTVGAERRFAPPSGGVRTRLAERVHGVFERRIRLADTPEPGRAAAHLQGGVLALAVPIASASRPRRITAQTGEAAPSAAGSGRAVPAAEPVGGASRPRPPAIGAARRAADRRRARADRRLPRRHALPARQCGRGRPDRRRTGVPASAGRQRAGGGAGPHGRRAAAPANPPRTGLTGRSS
ncbi:MULTISPECIES: Hsp20/alpha crystallin family protein [unclassified Kitasatospora]|uniref:Hsp20/alpha crystallin family protein n=1 Tax=unclassified Kitasatospora TaxID=2633591 RepID=UPI0033CA1591